MGLAAAALALARPSPSSLGGAVGGRLKQREKKTGRGTLGQDMNSWVAGENVFFAFFAYCGVGNPHCKQSICWLPFQRQPRYELLGVGLKVDQGLRCATIVFNLMD